MKDALFSICKPMGFKVKLTTEGDIKKVFIIKNKNPLFAFALHKSVDSTYSTVCDAAVQFLADMVISGEA
jgi:hypothetical protein